METFNRSTRAPSACAACAAKICRTCIQTYLLQDDGKDPMCASCKAPWTHTFLYSTLTMSFRTGPYKLHREKVLYDREKARLPDTQTEAQQYKNAKTLVGPLNQEIAAITAEMNAMADVAIYRTAKQKAEEEERAATKNKAWEERRKWWQSAERIEMLRQLEKLRKKARIQQKPFLARLATLHETITTPNYIVRNFGRLPVHYVDGVQVPAPPKERRQFIMKCPEETCEGFLSQQYKCGMCEIQVCAHCQVKKEDDDHICDQELVETIKQIKKEARPCPKCASLISKIDGCDQMWCTQCNTAFSWNTGKIETTVIHNPHYFAWMRATGQVLPRMGEGPAHACAEINTLAGTMNTLRRAHTMTFNPNFCKENETIVLGLDDFHRNALHIQQVTLHQYRHELRALNDEEPRRILRVRRLTNELQDADWKFSLQKKEKATYKVHAWIQLLEMYAASTLETMAQLKPDSSIDTLLSIKKQLDTLRTYVDKEAAAIAKLYSCVLPRDIRMAPAVVIFPTP
jgi:hypothetical protein